MTKLNPTIARFDRAARLAGLALREPSTNVREFTGGDRRYRVEPGGKGVLRIKSYVGEQLDAEVVASLARAESVINYVTSQES